MTGLLASVREHTVYLRIEVLETRNAAAVQLKERHGERLGEQRKRKLELYPVPVLFVILGRAYARNHKARGKLARLKGALSAHHGSGKGRRKAVSRPVAAPRHTQGEIIAKLAARAVIDRVADAPRLVGDALQNHMFCAEGRELFENCLHLALLPKSLVIGRIGEEAGLR